ncbi:alpha/beta fold hydrolase [Dactylosporangium cerinum]|uniref:Alpha/beta fold hydrolase n=1 Tax=Dactylosporangium cerinum TaxID=1434730 RepID=A0ABV9VP28_9ACTN
MKKAALLRSFTALTVVLGLLVGAAPNASGADSTDRITTRRIVATDHAVPHISTVPANAGESVKLFVRERNGTRPHQPRKAVLMLHGRTVPALAGLDFGTGRYNWALDLAQAGFDVFIMELQGSGRSPRPKMDDPCNADPAAQGVLIPNPLPAACPANYPHQLNNAKSDWDELNTVVDYIRSLRNVQKVALVGYSAAAFQVGPYTLQHPEKVSSVFLLAPIFPPDSTAVEPAQLPLSNPPAQFGFPMRIGTKAAFETSWNSEVHCNKQRESGMVDAVWNAIMDNDAVGRTWGPVQSGTPQGVMRIRNAFWWGWNKTTVPLNGTLGNTVPVLIVYGDLDTQANTPTSSGPVLHFSVPALYDAVPGARKLMFRVACTGHFMPWERQSRVLHDLSEQWLRRTAIDGLTNGSFFVDQDGDYTPTASTVTP